MKSISEEVITLYRRLADHTFSDCQTHCQKIDQCCIPDYCERTRKFAMRHGVELAETGHPTLPFMSDTGCVVAPHLRPECTEFICCIRENGRKVGDRDWTQKYYRLIGEIHLARFRERRGK